MRLTWHIFRKDARRLWREISLGTLVVALLARTEYYRADYIPGPLESLLGLLAPLAWAYLAARAIHGEAPADDREMWITQPYPRPALIGAKVLFLLAFVHLPLLVLHVAILLAKGFSPLAAAGPLLFRQALVAGLVTIPAAALASVTRNLAQFFLAAIVATVAGGLVMTSEPPSYPWVPVDEVRRGIPFLGIAGAGAAIVWLQYTRRRTGLARSMAIAASAGAALLFVLLPRGPTVALGCAITSGSHPEVRIGLAHPSPPLPAIGPPGRGRWFSPCPSGSTICRPMRRSDSIRSAWF